MQILIWLIDELSQHLGIIVFLGFIIFLIRKRKRSKKEYQEYIEKIKPMGQYIVLLSLLMAVPIALLVIALAIKGQITFLEMLGGIGVSMLIVLPWVIYYLVLYKKRHKSSN